MCVRLCILLFAVGMTACGSGSGASDNPFLGDGKEDSEFLNPDGIEVEVELQGDVEAPPTKIDDGPVTIAQYAMTYFRKREVMYLESLAEDAGSADRVDWLVDGTWVPADKVSATADRRRWLPQA